MSVYVTDTHPLIFFANQNQRQLSRRVWNIFQEAEARQAVIFIPAPALWEISFLEKNGLIKLDKPYEQWARELFSHPCYDCIPLDTAIIAEARQCHVNKDIFDAAIIATAKVKELPLITRDQAITDAGLVEVIW